MSATDIGAEIARLEDDLTVQRVILSSLENELFDGVEEERREARESALRIAGRLRQLKGQLKAQKSTVSSQDARTGHPDSGQGTVSDETYDPQHSSSSRARDPSGTPQRGTPGQRRDPQHTATPTRRTDIWGMPGSGSLPSRKRNISRTDNPMNGNLSKSRRTSPAPAGPSTQSPFSTQGSEVIDLTNLSEEDDVTDFVSRHKREENRRAQEKRDLEYAISVSSDDTVPPGPSGSTGRNAFDRLMATQRANAFAPTQSAQEPTTQQHDSTTGFPTVRANPSALTSSNFGPGSSGMITPSASRFDTHRPQAGPSWMQDTNGFNPGTVHYTPKMPGSYDTSWDDVEQTDAANVGIFPNRTQMPYPLANAARHAGDPNNYQSRDNMPQGVQGYPHIHQNGLPSRSAGSPSQTPGSNRNSGRGTRSMPPFHQWRKHGLGAVGSAVGNALAHIIESTSMYDYAAGVDAHGNPLSNRVASFFEDTDPYADPSVTKKDLEDLLKNIEPDVEVPEGLQGETPAALADGVRLYKHQTIALTWMKKMEDGTNKGGILADDMGLGKTISTLSLIHERKAESRPKTNLIVGPLALIRQWKEEIYKKTRPSERLSVYVHHGKKTTTDELLRHDVVLTTYGTIAAEVKRLDKWYEENRSRNIDASDSDLASKCPLLHPTKAKFHRVILDEAQCIKNERTVTAKACHKVKATYRWCLTGTPMMNSVRELYSLLKFLQIKPLHIWDEFRQAFGTLFGRRGDPKTKAMQRLRVLLKAIMLRRKKDSLLDGKPIIVLPEKTEQVVYAEFSQEERDFYTTLETKSQVTFNKYLRDGSIGKNYSNILVLLLRMRQACCHPHLNLDVDDAAPPVDVPMVERVRSLEATVVQRIKGIAAFECPVCYDAVESPAFFFPCGHDCCRPCLVQLADNAAQINIREGNESNKVKCITCRTQFDANAVFSYEAFQQVHMPEAVATAKAEDDGHDSSESEGSVSASDTENDDGSDVDAKGNLKDFIDDGDQDSDDENLNIKSALMQAKTPGMKGEPDSTSPKESAAGSRTDTDGNTGTSAHSKKMKKQRKSKGKGKEKISTSDIKPSMLKNLRKESFKNRAAFKKYMAYLRKHWLPSAKVEECIKLLKTIDDTGEKTIIFSQWTLLLDLMEVAMGFEFGKKPERYDGSMSAVERDTAAHAFREKRDSKVMLVSLRAGNAGLNLTSASRVIIMDPFWNPYIEMQAVDRAYRIGQKNEVQVYRILTKETVEDRIVALQERKKEMVEAALDEGESRKIGRLSTSELKYLFYGT